MQQLSMKPLTVWNEVKLTMPIQWNKNGKFRVIHFSHSALYYSTLLYLYSLYLCQCLVWLVYFGRHFAKQFGFLLPVFTVLTLLDHNLLQQVWEISKSMLNLTVRPVNGVGMICVQIQVYKGSRNIDALFFRCIYFLHLIFSKI